MRTRNVEIGYSIHPNQVPAIVSAIGRPERVVESTIRRVARRLPSGALNKPANLAAIERLIGDRMSRYGMPVVWANITAH